MFSHEGTIRALLTGDRLKQRIQHPKINECQDWKTPYWFFRYWHDEPRPDGSVKSTRKRRIVGPSKGPNAITRKQAEGERDKFLVNLNATPTRLEAATAPVATVAVPAPESEPGAIIFGRLAQMWRTDFVEKSVGGKPLLAAPTRFKYIFNTEKYILPRWKDTRLAEFRAKDVLDWLQNTCASWHHMADLRGIMSGVITKAQEWELLPETFANPMHRVKLPKKWEVREKRILDEEQTARVLARLEDPNLLICETCLDTGTRISEVTGLKGKHVDFDKGCIRIDQRNWRGDIDVPKTDKSKRLLALGDLGPRYKAWVGKLKSRGPEAWVFPQADNLKEPMWDSGVRQALKRAAHAEGCDFPGFGPHSLRRANITWRQEVGGSSIETSKIAGHANTKMTEEYTVVQLKRQEELTRRIQGRRAKAAKRSKNLNLVKPPREEAAA
jgi:integrase